MPPVRLGLGTMVSMARNRHHNVGTEIGTHGTLLPSSSLVTVRAASASQRSPMREAVITAWRRFDESSFARMFETWLFTVRRLT
jgi:hypothetical protein